MSLGADTTDIRAQLAVGRLSPIPQGPAEFQEDDARQQPRSAAPSISCPGHALASGEDQQCSEPAQHAPTAAKSTRSSSSSRAVLHRLYRRPQRCDMSGNWVPVLAATAIVLVITASAMYAQSESPPALCTASQAALLAEPRSQDSLCGAAAQSVLQMISVEVTKCVG